MTHPMKFQQALVAISVLCASSTVFAITDVTIGLDYSDTANQPGILVTSVGMLESSVDFLNDTIQNRIDGIRAGDKVFNPTWNTDAAGYNVWLNAGRLETNSHHLASIAYDGILNSSMLGADVEISSTRHLGLAVGYEWTKINTFFNTGVVNSKGFTFMPYYLEQVNETVNIGWNVGYTNANYNITHTNFATQDIELPVMVVGDQTSGHRLFAGMNITKECAVERSRVSSNIGVMFAREHFNAFDDPDSYSNLVDGTTYYTLGQVVSYNKLKTKDLRVEMGGTAAYEMDHVTPYVSGNIVWDALIPTINVGPLQQSPDRNNIGVQTALGLALNMSKYLVTRIEVKEEWFREDDDRHMVNVSLRAML